MAQAHRLAFGREVEPHLDRLLDRIDVEHLDIDFERRFRAGQGSLEDVLDRRGLVIKVREQDRVGRDQRGESQQKGKEASAVDLRGRGFVRRGGAGRGRRMQKLYSETSFSRLSRIARTPRRSWPRFSTSPLDATMA